MFSSPKKRQYARKTNNHKFQKKKFKNRNELEENAQEAESLFESCSDQFLKNLEVVEQNPALTANLVLQTGSDFRETERMPVWVDDDDEIEVGEVLDNQNRQLPNGGINTRSNQYLNVVKNKFTKIVGTPKWASSRINDDNSDGDDEILNTCGFIKKTAGKDILQSILEFKKVKDLNTETYSEGPFINAVEFHPTSSAALVAGNSGIVTLYAVDGKRNNKLHSVAFERFPILCAKFVENGNEAILGSRQSHVYNYDLMAAKATKLPLPPGLTQCKNFIVSSDSRFIAIAGKWGEVHLLSCSSFERIALLKQDSEVMAMTFDPDCKLLFGHSGTGEITVWDLSKLRVKHKFMDEGCIQGSTLAISPSNQYIATGSAQGVVNLYVAEDVLCSKLPKPRKTVFNLTTNITNLTFNHSSELLAIVSVEIENSVRLLHVKSSTIFSNFPSFGTTLGHVSSFNFSPNSGYIGFGNKESTVSLYRLKHYKTY